MLRIGLARKYKVIISLQQEHLASFKPQMECYLKKNKIRLFNYYPSF